MTFLSFILNLYTVSAFLIFSSYTVTSFILLLSTIASSCFLLLYFLHCFKFSLHYIFLFMWRSIKEEGTRHLELKIDLPFRCRDFFQQYVTSSYVYIYPVSSAANKWINSRFTKHPSSFIYNYRTEYSWVALYFCLFSHHVLSFFRILTHSSFPYYFTSTLHLSHDGHVTLQV